MRTSRESWSLRQVNQGRHVYPVTAPSADAFSVATSLLQSRRKRVRNYQLLPQQSRAEKRTSHLYSCPWTARLSRWDVVGMKTLAEVS